MVVPGQDSLAMGQQRLGELLQHADAGLMGFANPGLQMASRGGFIGKRPQLPQIFLQIVGGKQ